MGLKRGKDFYEDITSHMKSSSLTNDELRNIAKKYRTKIEWYTNDRNTYRQAYNRDKKFPGFWEDITSDMGSDDILDRIVEEFYDTGKLKLSEDIEFDVDNEDFGVETEEEIEIYDDENIPQKQKDYINKEYGWLTGGTNFNTMTSGITNKDVYKAKYILTNEIKKGNSLVYLRNNFLEFLNKVNAILGTDIKITEDTFLRMTTRNLENTKDVYGLSDEQIKKWVEAKEENKKKNQLKPLKREEIEGRLHKLKKYLSKIDVWKIDYTKNKLLDEFGLLNVKNFEFSEIINAFEGIPTKEFYLKFISKSVDDNTIRAHWLTFVKYSKAIKEIIDNNKIPDEQIEKTAASTQKYMESLKQYFNKIKKQEYCYIFNNNCKLSSSDIEKVMEFFGETYENSFINKGFKKDSKSVESRIHDLDKVGFSFSEKIKSDDFDVDEISKFIIKNIENYLEISGITKYDILTNREIKDEGGNVIIPKDGKVEVKDINKQDSYLSEFLASPVKKTEYGIRNNPIYLKRYNDVIGKVYNHLKNKWEDDIKEKIKNDLEGIIISNNIYVPNKNDNIEFYLSNVGRSNPEKQLRISVRYHINKNNWRNFYKIDDDGILYPLKKEPDIPTKEKRIYETKSKLDNIIENFFDTGKFVI
jgi:hypothetical protein